MMRQKKRIRWSKLSMKLTKMQKKKLLLRFLLKIRQHKLWTKFLPKRKVQRNKWKHQKMKVKHYRM